MPVLLGLLVLYFGLHGVVNRFFGLHIGCMHATAKFEGGNMKRLYLFIILSVMTFALCAIASADTVTNTSGVVTFDWATVGGNIVDGLVSSLNGVLPLAGAVFVAILGLMLGKKLFKMFAK